jgi:hypothetical protein
MPASRHIGPGPTNRTDGGRVAPGSAGILAATRSAFATAWRRTEGVWLTARATGHPAGAPGEHYGNLQSEEAIRYAGEVLAFVDSQMA